MPISATIEMRQDMLRIRRQPSAAPTALRVEAITAYGPRITQTTQDTVDGITYMLLPYAKGASGIKVMIRRPSFLRAIAWPARHDQTLDIRHAPDILWSTLSVFEFTGDSIEELVARLGQNNQGSQDLPIILDDLLALIREHFVLV